MSLYDYQTTTFAWNGVVYGPGTRVIFKDDFVNNFSYNGEKIYNRASFQRQYGKTYEFQLYGYGLNYWEASDYAQVFYLTELELYKAIESIGPRPCTVIQTSACIPPPNKQRELDSDKSVEFFKYKDGFYGHGTEIYVTDPFIDYYYHKSGGRMLSKKLEFLSSDFNENENKRYYYLYYSKDMVEGDISYYDQIVVLSEEEFFQSIECIVEACTIHYSMKEHPIVLILWFIFILLSIFISKMFSVNSAGAIVFVLLMWFWKINKVLLNH